MKIGDVVRIEKCEGCPSMVGKTATVRKVVDDNTVELNYGRGRPLADRPKTICVNDVTVVE